MPCITVGHGVHELPHEVTASLETHAPLQVCEPGAHVTPHVPAMHVACSFAPVAHASHFAPQLPVAESLTHDCPHACFPEGHTHWWLLVWHIAPLGQSASR